MTRNPLFINVSMTLRDVWLFPAPVRTAVTEISGLLLFNCVFVGPNREKSAPAALTIAPIPITVS